MINLTTTLSFYYYYYYNNLYNRDCKVMDMNRKGQALVEFVLILPVMILILFTIYDFGNLLVSKNKLENTCTDVARLVRNGEKC